MRFVATSKASIDNAEGLPVVELRADAARNRASVINVARRQVAEGDLSLQMNSIAKLAGVGVGTVYRHFPTKQSLLESLAADSFVALIAEARLATAERDPAKALERLLHRALHLLVNDPGLAAVLAAPQFECAETLHLGFELGALVSTVLDRARRARVIRSDVTADDIRRLMCGGQQAMQIEPESDDKLELYLQILLAGLRGPTAARSRSPQAPPPPYRADE
jgi:AcrR family transcriptional regulator